MAKYIKYLCSYVSKKETTSPIAVNKKVRHFEQKNITKITRHGKRNHFNHFAHGHLTITLLL